MPDVPRIALSNPGLGVFVQQTGRALHEAGMLKRFLTTLVDRPGAPWRPVVTGKLDAVLRKRALTEFPVELVRTYATRELLRLLTREVDRSEGVWTDAVWEWAEEGFDRWVARRGLDGANAVYGYEHACLRTFQEAKRRGIACYYEVPAPEAGYAQRLRNREIAAHPELDSDYERRLRAMQGKRQEHRQQEWELADCIVACSEFTKSTYRESGYDVSRVTVVPLAAPPVCADASMAVRSTRLASGGPLRFLSMGLLALHKGSHHLIEAWRKLEPGQDARLEMVGGVALPERLLDDLPGNVALRPRVPTTATLEIYREADVLVFPTLADGFGMVVSEAMSQGLPVITTTRAGAAEMITNGSNGMIVPPGDPAALAAAMRWCLEHREALAEMGIRAREAAGRWQWADYRRALRQTVSDGYAARAQPGGDRPHKGRTGASVCLITPAHLSGNPRLVKEADALQAAGYRTHVIAADVAKSLRGMDLTILSRAQWSCTLVGRGTLVGYAALTFLQRSAQFLLGRSRGRWASIYLARLAHHRLTGILSRAACRVPADLYHAHNLGALPAAADAARRHGAKLGFDAEDFHSGELTEQQENRGSHAARAILEAAFLPRCDLLTAGSPGIAAEYHRLYGVTMHPLLNVFPLHEAPAQSVEPLAETTEGRRVLSLYWFSQTVGAGRGLEPMIAALARMRHPARLYLRGAAHPEFVEELHVLARQAGMPTDAIRMLPVTPPGDLIRESAAYDLGLGLEMNVPRNRAICLTNKIFVYLLAGVPVLLSRTPAQEQLCASLGPAARLIDLDDPAGIARCLDEYAADAPMRQAARDAAWTLGRERYNWDDEQVRFLDFLRSALETSACKR